MVTAFLFYLNDVIVGLLTTEMVFTEGVVHTFCYIVESPIHTIEKQVYIESINTYIAYLALHTSCPYVTGILGTLTIAFSPMLPSVTKMTTHNYLVELLRSFLSK